MKRLKSKLITVIIIVLVLLMAANADTVTRSVTDSLSLCAFSVIPSLFPFFVLCEILTVFLAASHKNTAVIAFVCALISGFPAGVNNVCLLYKDGKLDKSAANRLLYCCANASPAYIVSFIGARILQNRKAGIALLAAQTAVAFFVALFFGVFKSKSFSNAAGIPLIRTLCDAVKRAVINTLYICGYITFFSVLADIANQTGIVNTVSELLFFIPSEKAKALIIGAIEITKGMELTSDIALAGMLLGFSGISVIMQCISCTAGSGLSVKNIVIGKLIYSTLIPPIAYVLYTVVSQNGALYGLVVFAVLTVLAFSVYFIFDKSPARLYNKKKNTEKANDLFKRYNTDVSVL